MKNVCKYRIVSSIRCFSAMQRVWCRAQVIGFKHNSSYKLQVKFVAAVDFWFSILSFLSMFFYIFVEDIFS